MLDQHSTWHALAMEVGNDSVTYEAKQVADLLPPVPVKLVTRLRLELLVMRSSAIDLKLVSEAILKDAGATLQLLRVVGEEYGDADCRPSRIEHCLASLNRDRWFEAVCSSVMNSQSKELYATWEQFYWCAYYTRLVALETGGVPSEEAYVVGLLHQLGKLPQLLRWTPVRASTAAEQRAVGQQLARHWYLPEYLSEALCESPTGSIHSRWSFLLHSAQREMRKQESSAHDLSDRAL